MIFNPSRDDARNFLFDSWRKYREASLLTPLEEMVVRLVVKHPEYHALLENPTEYQHKDYIPEQGEPNPFLHLMMHLTMEEQISIDQPPGILSHYKRLTALYNSEHDAQHKMMECLGEMLWQAQRNSTGPDVGIYFSCLNKV
jgi:hypothetical protein